jgi:RsiW-degrading membrane proteinase PrsW (M82 family)
MHIDLSFLVLDSIGVFLLIKWLFNLVKESQQLTTNKFRFFFKRMRFILLILLLLFIPILLVNYTDIELIRWIKHVNQDKKIIVYAVIVSFAISFFWLVYIIKLDIFDQEKKRYIYLILLFSTLLTLLVSFPYAFIHNLGFVDSTIPSKSFIYSVFGIGLIEESIKLIPLLLILSFTKAIDEPYDYILYASISALGFAFVENILYLRGYGLHIINARALYSTVAHMVFSSTIAYGLFLIKYKFTKIPAFFVFVFFFLIAIFSHGFYDFWLMNKIASQNSWLTTVFLLLLVHTWFSMINNTINTSNYYAENKSINNDRLKMFLIIGLLSIFMFSYVYIAFSKNSVQANKFIKTTLLVYAYIIFYLIATLSKFELVKGVIKPLKFSWNFLFPSMGKKK